MLILAFDTATDVATSALLDDGEVLGERSSVAKTLLEDVDALLRQASARPRDLDALVVGTGPGSFTGTRIGLAVARGLALALGIEGAGVSTLDALAAGAEGAVARDRRAPRRGLRPRSRGRVAPERRRRRRERCASATAPSGTGAVLEAAVREVPPDDDPAPLPRAALHARLADDVRPGRGDRAGLRRAPRTPSGGADDARARAAASRARATSTRSSRSSGRRTATPWSRSMFASRAREAELALVRRGGRDGGARRVLVLSRYVDAWHVMNVAVAPERRRQGIASALLQRLLELTKDDALRGYTLEVRVSNTGAIELYERFGFRVKGRAPRATTPTTARTRSSCGATPSAPRTNPPSAAERGARSSGSRRRATRPPRRSSTTTAIVRSSVVASQADLHARYGGVVPEIASRRHLELVAPVVSAALEDASIGLDDVAPRRRHAGPGPRRRAARRAVRCEGARLGAGPPARPGRPPPRSRRDAVPRARPARPAVHVPARERRSHAASRGARPVGVRRARLDARRRGRRGVRQGRAAARARLSRAAPRSTGSRGTATRRRSPSRSRASPASISRSRGSRPRSCTRCATSPRPSSTSGGPISPPRTSGRSCAPSSGDSAPPPQRRATGRSRSSAAWPRTDHSEHQDAPAEADQEQVAGGEEPGEHQPAPRDGDHRDRHHQPSRDGTGVAPRRSRGADHRATGAGQARARAAGPAAAAREPRHRQVARRPAPRRSGPR